MEGLAAMPYQLSLQQMMWEVEVGKDGQEEKSYLYRSFSSQLMMEAEGEAGVEVVEGGTGES